MNNTHYLLAQISLPVIAATIIFCLEALHSKGKINGILKYMLLAVVFMTVGAVSVIIPLLKYGVL